MTRASHITTIVFTALLCALEGYGATLPKADEFVRGPAQWYMTGNEMRGIRAAKTDEEAQRLIDLFWVRRDPTPGTARNEFREELEARVVYADKEFKFKNKRGSLTDSGKIYILLGPPKERNQFGLDASVSDFGLNHGMGGRYEWNYPLGTEMGLNGPVIFIENVTTHEYLYDIQHGNIGGAIARAREKAVVSPGLTEVPAWAVERPAAVSEMTLPSLAPADPSVVAPVAPVAPRMTTRSAPREPVVQPLPLPPAGVRTLILTRDVAAIDPRAGSDPLGHAASSASFTTQDDLGYAFQYCGGTRDAQPSLGLKLTISGESEGKKVHFSAADDDLVPDGIPTLAGCYIVRGSLPLSEVGRGSYELALALTDKTSHHTYDMKQAFKVE